MQVKEWALHCHKNLKAFVRIHTRKINNLPKFVAYIVVDTHAGLYGYLGQWMAS